MPSFDGQGQRFNEIERMDSTDSWPRDKGSVDGSEGSGVMQPLTSGLLMRSSLLHAREKQNLVRQLVQKTQRTKNVGAVTPPMGMGRQVSEAQSSFSRGMPERQLTQGSLESEPVGTCPQVVLHEASGDLVKAMKEMAEQQVRQSEELMESLECLKLQSQETRTGLDDLSRSLEAQSQELGTLRAQDPGPGLNELQQALRAQAAQLQAQADQLGALRPQETSQNLAEVRRVLDGLSRDMENFRGQDATLKDIRRTVEAQAKEVDSLRGQEIAHCLSEFRRTLETQSREIEAVRAQAREDSLTVKTVKASLEIYDKSSTQRAQEVAQASAGIRKLVEESREAGAAGAKETMQALEDLRQRLQSQGQDVELLRGEELGKQLAEARQLLETQNTEVELLRAQVTASYAEVSRALEQHGPKFASLLAQDPAPQLAEMRRSIELQGHALESLRSQELHITLRAVKESMETYDRIGAVRAQETHLALERLRDAVTAHSRELEQLKLRDSQGSADDVREFKQEMQAGLRQLREALQANSSGLAELGAQVSSQRQASLAGHQELLAGLATQAQLEELRTQLDGLRGKEVSQEVQRLVLTEENERIKAQVALLEQREQQHLALIEGLEREKRQMEKQTLAASAYDASKSPTIFKDLRGVECGRGIQKYVQHKKRASLAVGATVVVLAVVTGSARVILRRRLAAAPAVMLAQKPMQSPAPLHQLQRLPAFLARLVNARHRVVLGALEPFRAANCEEHRRSSLCQQRDAGIAVTEVGRRHQGFLVWGGDESRHPVTVR